MKNITLMSFISLLGLVLLTGFVFLKPVEAAKPPSAVYSISITDSTISGLEVNISGEASSTDSKGGPYSIDIDWGDSTSDEDIYPALDSGSLDDGVSWGSVSHTYSVSGSYTITVKLCHSNCNGEDGEVETTDTLDIEIEESETGSLTVVKTVVGGEATTSDFMLYVDGDQVISGEATTTSAGSHTVTEDQLDGYVASFSENCPDGVIEVIADDSVTCTITNTYNVEPPLDTEPPVITVSDITKIITGSTTTVEYSPTAYDDFMATSTEVTCDPVSGSEFSLGTTTVTCTSTDDSDNTATSTFDVIIIQSDEPDNTPPVIDEHADVTATTTATSTIVTYTNPEANDDFDGPVEVTCEPPSGSLFEIGTTTVTCTATDSSDNVATSTFNVIVEQVSDDPEDTTDVCSNIDGDQTEVPEGKEVNNEGQCIDKTTSSGTRRGGSSGSSGSNQSQGEVLGATTDVPIACGPYLLSYLGAGRSNSEVEVLKLQIFLNFQNLGFPINVSGQFDPITDLAVRIFQVNERTEILTPWVNAGILSTDTVGTGYVYKTTLRRINNLVCPSLNLPFPQLP